LQRKTNRKSAVNINGTDFSALHQTAQMVKRADETQQDAQKSNKMQKLSGNAVKSATLWTTTENG